MKTFLITTLVAAAMMVGAIDLTSAQTTGPQTKCQNYSDYASKIKTNKC